MIKYRDSEEMAIEHVDWFFKMVRPILIEHMIHGYKHGFTDGINYENQIKEIYKEENKEKK